jgi:serine protease Do
MRVNQLTWRTLCFVTLSLGVACDSMAQSASSLDPADAPAQAATPALSSASVAALKLPDLASLAAQMMPSVVSIQVEQYARTPTLSSGDPFGLFNFYGQQAPQAYANRGIGSGFVIDGSGLILTNQHVIEKADSIVVSLTQPDGGERRVAARVIGTAPDYDVALLKADLGPAASAAALQPIALGDSAAMRIGDWVMAIGNPFGLDHSVSVGIISAKDRRDVAPSGRQGLYDFLQTDASINPGNSGGPLINLHGEVIGINAAINAQGQGIGFAIPINMVKEMLPQLKSHGTFVRSFLGVHAQPLSDELAQSFGLHDPQGVLIAEVVDGGPAQAAGVVPGDIVLSFGGKKLLRASDLQLFASMAGAGKEVVLRLWRDGRELSSTVKLAPLPKAPVAEPVLGRGPGSEAVEPATTAHMGLMIADLSPALRARLGGGSGSGGTLIQRVTGGGAASQAGLMRLDIIEAVGDEPVVDARQFADRVGRAASGALLRLRILRQGTHAFVVLKKP